MGVYRLARHCYAAANPHLKADPGPVTNALQQAGASVEILAVWQDCVQQDSEPVDEEDDF